MTLLSNQGCDDWLKSYNLPAYVDLWQRVDTWPTRTFMLPVNSRTRLEIAQGILEKLTLDSEILLMIVESEVWPSYADKVLFHRVRGKTFPSVSSKRGQLCDATERLKLGSMLLVSMYCFWSILLVDPNAKKCFWLEDDDEMGFSTSKAAHLLHWSEPADSLGLVERQLAPYAVGGANDAI